MEKEKLEKMIELQKEVRSLYSNTGLTSLEFENGIMLSSEYFFDNFDQFVVKERKGHYKNPARVETEYKNITFYALLDQNEAWNLRELLNENEQKLFDGEEVEIPF